ncbi:MAG: ComF family protein [Bacillota bacterium]|nr:ComF family protein [Bacillota bacterium]
MPCLNNSSEHNSLKKKWTEKLLELIFPERCLFCHAISPSEEWQPFCHSCRKSYSSLGIICPVCESIDLGVKQCKCGSPAESIKKLFALSGYEGKWRLLLHDLKYKKKKHLARPLGNLLGYELLKKNFMRADFLAPVPLHHRREKDRGFNQSALIAGYAAKALNTPCIPLLSRLKDTVSQTTITRYERRSNVRGAFECIDQSCKGKKVLLIDDIYSTGSTMNEAARTLRKSGAEVFGAVIAYNFRNSL